MEIKETTVGPKIYLVWRAEIDTKNIMDRQMWQNAYGKVHGYAQTSGITMTGHGVAIYFRWDEPPGTGELAIGNPVVGVNEVNDPGLSLVHVPESKAVMAAVHGAYEELGKNHSILKSHLKEREAEETLVIEEYVVTGMDKPDSKDWETNIYHLYDER
jgi:hypothetical protein